MKRTIVKISFLAIVIMSLFVNFSQSKRTNTGDASLVSINMLAIASAEADDPYVCIAPPRTICHFLSDWSPIYGIHY